MTRSRLAAMRSPFRSRLATRFTARFRRRPTSRSRLGVRSLPLALRRRPTNRFRLGRKQVRSGSGRVMTLSRRGVRVRVLLSGWKRVRWRARERLVRARVRASAGDARSGRTWDRSIRVRVFGRRRARERRDRVSGRRRDRVSGRRRARVSRLPLESSLRVRDLRR